MQCYIRSRSRYCLSAARNGIHNISLDVYGPFGIAPRECFVAEIKKDPRASCCTSCHTERLSLCNAGMARQKLCVVTSALQPRRHVQGIVITAGTKGRAVCDDPCD